VSTETLTTPHLVALDIDGTILETGKPPSDAVVAAVRDLVAGGHHPVLATGRSLLGATQAVKWLELREAWIVASNGAITARVGDGRITVIERHNVDVETIVRHVVAKLRLRIAAEIPGEGYRVTERFAGTELPGTHHLSNLEGMWSTTTPRVSVVGDGAAWLADDFHEMGMTADAPHSGWLDVTAGGVSKAAALERVRVALDVSPARTVAVGDGTNDIGMLQWAARGVAMGHARGSVRDAANEVTGTITDDGVLPVLRDVARWPART
jgi:hydroxymethylpyrimidine pyrophosphatase-like HAD family hydrolase